MRTHCNIDNAVDLEIAKFIIKNNKGSRLFLLKLNRNVWFFGSNK